MLIVFLDKGDVSGYRSRPDSVPVPITPKLLLVKYSSRQHFLPAAAIGVLFGELIRHYLLNAYVVSAMLVVGGVAILLIERMVKIPQYYAVEDFPLVLYLKIGLIQCLGMVPGVSRSGATIMGSLLLKVERSAAAEFSFFLAIPTMLGAAVYSLYKHWADLHTSDMMVLAIGFVVAYISAYYVAKAFISFVSNHGFGVFAWYRIVFGLVVIATWQFGLVEWTAH